MKISLEEKCGLEINKCARREWRVASICAANRSTLPTDEPMPFQSESADVNGKIMNEKLLSLFSIYFAK